MPRWEYREPPGHFFSALQRKQVEALFEAIVPGGQSNPGAIDAGAVEYVDRLLAMDAATYYDIPRWQQQYAVGLPILAAAASRRYSKPLEQFTTEEATTLLSELARGVVLGDPEQQWQKDFFATLRGHAIEGCFADQRWGGNRDNVIWEWYGYPTGPARDFKRNAATAHANEGPIQPNANEMIPGWRPTHSGNTTTAIASPERSESATLVSSVAEKLAAIAATTNPGEPWPDPESREFERVRP
jgi:gluconate 2-dehydrogenase gamma chain